MILDYYRLLSYCIDTFVLACTKVLALELALYMVYCKIRGKKRRTPWIPVQSAVEQFYHNGRRRNPFLLIIYMIRTSWREVGSLGAADNSRGRERRARCRASVQTIL